MLHFMRFNFLLCFLLLATMKIECGCFILILGEYQNATKPYQEFVISLIIAISFYSYKLLASKTTGIDSR